MMNLSRCKLVIPVLLVGCAVFGQDPSVFKPDSIRRKHIATEISSSLKVDGFFREEEWKKASVSNGFTEIEPDQGNVPAFRTDLRVLYNRQYLYFGIYARDSMGRKSIRANDFKRDFSPDKNDITALVFDGFNDKRNAMAFTTNPYGVQRDLLSFDDSFYDVDWDALWRVRTSRTDSGWYAEIAIPWQTLRYRGKQGETQEWGFNVLRNRRLSNEVSAFSPYPRSFTVLRMDYAGLLANLRPPPPKPNIRVVPYMLAEYNRQRNDGVSAGGETVVKAGGEVKWAINPNSVLDLTVNTDFAQADADRQVNNVTRFSVFFPERRQFFLENASLFGFGIKRNPDESGGNMHIQPFFSRRIGLDDTGNPIPIVAGGRYVYRSAKRNFGAMAMRQKGTDDLPGTNFLIARFSENLGERNRIGGMLTVKDQPGGSNLSGTADAFFRLSESHTLSTMASVTSTTATARKGLSAYAQYTYVSNQLKIWWTQSIVTKDYDPQMGFVSRNDVIGTTPGIFWWYRGKKLPFKKILRAWEPSIFPEFYHSVTTGKLIERTWTFYPVWLNFQSGAYFGYNISPTYQFLTEPFEPLGILIKPGAYRYDRQLIYASTDPSKKLNLQVMYQWGTYFNGRLRSGDWTLQFAPVPHFSLLGRFNRNRFMDVGEQPGDVKIDLYSIEARMALNPRLQLIAFYQQNSENASKNYNIRFSWEYAPLSYVYLVLNQRQFQDISLKTRTDDQAIIKISYLKQF
jgi:hypothetical protein